MCEYQTFFACIFIQFVIWVETKDGLNGCVRFVLGYIFNLITLFWNHQLQKSQRKTSLISTKKKVPIHTVATAQKVWKYEILERFRPFLVSFSTHSQSFCSFISYLSHVMHYDFLKWNCMGAESSSSFLETNTQFEANGIFRNG